MSVGIKRRFSLGTGAVVTPPVSSALPFPVSTTLVARTPDTLAKPGYLQSVTDSAFPGVKITRVSNGPEFGQTGAYIIDTGYSKRQPWSRNGTWLRVGTRHLLNGNTYAYVDLMDTTYKLWSNVYDNIQWHFYKSGLIQRATIGADGTQTTTNWMDVSTLVSGYDSTYNMSVGNYEGNLSADDKYLIVEIKQSGVVKQALLNLENKTVVWVSDVAPVSANGYDWVTVTPSGLYLVASELDGTGSTYNKRSHDLLTRNLVQNNLGIYSHRDLGYLEDGTEVLYGVNDPVAYNIITGAKTTLLPGMATVLGASSGHGSGRAFDMKGWLLHSMTNSSAPYKEILFIAGDGSGKTMRLANARLSSTHSTYGPQAAPKHDGTKILFASDWMNGTGPVDAYVLSVA